jgi:hypothetical protein
MSPTILLRIPGRNSVTHFKLLILLLVSCFLHEKASGQSVSLANEPLSLKAGTECTVEIKSELAAKGIVQAQLVDSSWKKVAEQWKEVEAGKQSTSLTIKVPADATKDTDYFWQILLYDSDWKKQTESIVKGVEIGATKQAVDPKEAQKANEKLKPAAGPDWTPDGQWAIDWQDEFDGKGLPKNWHPFLGYTPTDFADRTEKGIRWNGKTEDTSQMYSAKSGHHWLNGEGQLVLQIAADKTKQNANGVEVDGAYLMTGFPEKWDKAEPSNVKWGGKFVSPTDAPLYISARIKTNELKGYSTWFAFWLFSKTRAYNGNPTDGTEVDVVEIPKGKKDYINKAFNVANHWAQNGKGSESLQLNGASEPKSTDLVDVNDDQYHTYGVEWTKKYMKCYVDGKLYYTFTENIPSEPVDMMILLTLEFQKNAWDPDQGDGRFEGPFVSDNAKQRVMSRVFVDFVRVYKKQ